MDYFKRNTVGKHFYGTFQFSDGNWRVSESPTRSAKIKNKTRE
jgi:hypothetical protein